MKILLLGANGQLGRELEVALLPLGEVVRATRDGRSASGASALAIDLEQPDETVATIGEVGADVIVNAAAYTAVDRAEDEPNLAHRINAEAPAEIARQAARSGSLFVHFSTDYVFGNPPQGTKARPWRESDPAEPLNVYGASKLAGERAIQESGCDHLILRTSWLYAGHGRNFLRTMLRLARKSEPLRVVDDQIGSPTWARDVAGHTATILFRGPACEAIESGTYHVAAAGEATWYEYAELLLQTANEHGLVDETPAIDAVSSDNFGAPATRPRYSVLDCSLAAEMFDVQPPEWRHSLVACIAELHRPRNKVVTKAAHRP